jgi:hypothetical protein
MVLLLLLDVVIVVVVVTVVTVNPRELVQFSTLPTSGFSE